MSQPLLSLCIPTYNRCSYLEKLLENICYIKSTLGPRIEIIISNNASTDKTHELLSSYKSKVDFVYIKNSQNLGFSGNMNILLAASSGLWLLFAGDDDLINVHNLAKLVNRLESSPQNMWMYLPIQNSWLSRLKPGYISPISSILLLLRLGVSDFGFIGSHVIPSTSKVQCLQIPIDYSLHWAHVNWWILHVFACRPFYACSLPIVYPQPNDSHKQYSRMFWQELWISRLSNIARVVVFFRLSKALLLLLYLREAFSISAIKEKIHFSLPYPKTAWIRMRKVISKCTSHPYPTSLLTIVLFSCFLAFSARSLVKLVL